VGELFLGKPCFGKRSFWDSCLSETCTLELDSATPDNSEPGDADGVGTVEGAGTVESVNATSDGAHYQGGGSS
jgi:hypothetical protein